MVVAFGFRKDSTSEQDTLRRGTHEKVLFLDCTSQVIEPEPEEPFDSHRTGRRMTCVAGGRARQGACVF